MKSKKLHLIIFILVIFSLIKIDYRFQEIPYGLEVDDAEYYYSAVTIGIDFDLDFSNQMSGIENRFLNKEIKKIVPFHPIGSGALASPFIMIGNFLQRIFEQTGLISIVYFLYSLSPIFYLLISIILIQNSLKSLEITFNNNLLLLSVLGTGISYYSFDRFSMSHIYEFFGTSFLIYLTTKSLKEQDSFKLRCLNFLLGFLMFFFLSIRWTNYLYFLIPLIIYLISGRTINKLYFKASFLIGWFIGLALFLYHTKYLYGIYTLNQAPIVLSVENSFSTNFSRFFDLSLLMENMIFLFRGLGVIVFSQEFGIFFFAPIIFISFILVIYLLFNKQYLLSLILIFLYLIPFMSVVVIQNTAFSYGYRYLFVLIPINLVLYFKYLNDYKILRLYLYIFSILGFLLYLFFETSQWTSLADGYVVNSFGMNTRYANPEYLSGLPKAFLDLNAYLHILFTSFLGVLILKVIYIVLDPVLIFSKFTEITPEISDLIFNSINFSWYKLIFLYLFVIYFFNKIFKLSLKH
jgi:hypothetical protein